MCFNIFVLVIMCAIFFSTINYFLILVYFFMYLLYVRRTVLLISFTKENLVGFPHWFTIQTMLHSLHVSFWCIFGLLRLKEFFVVHKLCINISDEY